MSAEARVASQAHRRATRKNAPNSAVWSPDDHLERWQSSRGSGVIRSRLALSRRFAVVALAAANRQTGAWHKHLYTTEACYCLPNARAIAAALLAAWRSFTRSQRSSRRGASHPIRPGRESRRRTAPAQRLDLLEERRIGAQAR